MFKILSYKGNANQNSIENPSHPSHNGYHQRRNSDKNIMKTRHFHMKNLVPKMAVM
jgi:hypothetical protein